MISAGEDGEVLGFQQALDRASSLLRTHPRIVFMMCGIAGSGKTTFAQALEGMGCRRLSIDEEIWRTYGRFGVDYPQDEYPILQSSAEKILREQLVQMLRTGTKAVIDFSFWKSQTRADYRELVHRSGHHCQIVFLKVPENVLRERLVNRASRRDANAAFPITDDLLQRYIQGFEPPSGQDAWTVE